jgi:ABC-type Fe3+/spermidine/putrescine transport system ATPase subunit
MEEITIEQVEESKRILEAEKALRVKQFTDEVNALVEKYRVGFNIQNALEGNVLKSQIVIKAI